MSQTDITLIFDRLKRIEERLDKMEGKTSLPVIRLPLKYKYSEDPEEKEIYEQYMIAASKNNWRVEYV